MFGRVVKFCPAAATPSQRHVKMLDRIIVADITRMNAGEHEKLKTGATPFIAPLIKYLVKGAL